jgi:hypothetical protein
VFQALGSHFKTVITQPKDKKNSKMVQGHLKWDQNKLIDEKLGAKNLVRLTLQTSIQIPVKCTKVPKRHLYNNCTTTQIL